MHIFPQAHKRKLYYPGYAWITVGIDVQELLQTTYVLSENCTIDDIQTVLNYSLVMEHPSQVGIETVHTYT